MSFDVGLVRDFLAVGARSSLNETDRPAATLLQRTFPGERLREIVSRRKRTQAMPPDHRRKISRRNVSSRAIIRALSSPGTSNGS